MSLHPRRATRAQEQDLELMERTGMLGMSMTNYFSGRMQEEWREQEDAKPIRFETTLNAALNKTHSQIVDAICHTLGISSKGKRQDKARKITDQLTAAEQLRAVIAKLDAPMKLALQHILDAGGWIRWNVLTREFGDQEGDEWFWNEKPPQSLLGRLRITGLVFVGTAKVGKGKTMVAVIPTDLRESLAAQLVRYQAEMTELGNYNVTRALLQFEQHYREPEYPPVIPRAWFEAYLLELGVKKDNAFDAWQALEHFDYFLSRSLVQKLDDITPRQLSVWLTVFLQSKYVGDFPVTTKRAMAKQVAGFYKWLAARGDVAESLAQQIQDAADAFVKQKGNLAPEELPPPLGGEVIVEGQHGSEREVFTYNDRWLLIVCIVDFEGDLNQLYTAAAKVEDGVTKQRMIARLRQFDAELWNALTQNITQQEADFAWDWFNTAPVMTASAW